MRFRYRLRADKKGLVLAERGRWVTDQARRQTLPDVPADMPPIEGDYQYVAHHARTLNDIQERDGRKDYLYSPDIITEDVK